MCTFPDALVHRACNVDGTIRQTLPASPLSGVTNVNLIDTTSSDDCLQPAGKENQSVSSSTSHSHSIQVDAFFLTLKDLEPSTDTSNIAKHSDNDDSDEDTSDDGRHSTNIRKRP